MALIFSLIPFIVIMVYNVYYMLWLDFNSIRGFCSECNGGVMLLQCELSGISDDDYYFFTKCSRCGRECFSKDDLDDWIKTNKGD